MAQSIAQGLATRGHELRVITGGLGWRSVREGDGPVEVLRVGTGRRKLDTCSVPEMGAYVAASLIPTLQANREWRPDVIHAHFAVPTGAVAWAAHRITGVPYVLTAHLGDVPGGVPEQTDRLFRMIGPAARAIWRSAAAATAVSSFVQDLAQRAYHRPVECILNGIDLAARPPPPERVGAPPHLIFLGRFNPQKNVLGLIGSLATVSDLPWRLTLIGDGPDMPAARETIAAAGLGERVQLRGWLKAAEVQLLLAEGDVLCIPSHAEGLPVAAVEALRAGLAIAGSDIPGLRDVLIPGENGIAAHPDAYADALRTMLTDEQRLLTMRHASWRLAANFALDPIIARYEKLLSISA